MTSYVAGRYKARQRLGSGAFGDIYYGTGGTTLGTDSRSGEEVAIKLVLARHL